MTRNNRILFRRALGTLGIVVLFAAMWRFRTLVGYLLISVALSFVGRPVVKALGRIQVAGRALPNTLGATLALTLMIMGVVSVIQLFAPLAIDQAQAVRNLDPQNVRGAFGAIAHWLDQDLGAIDFSGEGLANSEFFLRQAQSILQFDVVGSLFGGLLGLVGNLFVAAFSILFMTFFFLRDHALYRKIIFSLTPDAQEKRVGAILNQTSHLLTRYFGGLIIQVIIITTVVSVGTALAGAQHAFLIGLMAGIFNLIPYIGPLVGAGLGMLLIATTATGQLDSLPALLGWSAGAFLLAQIIDNLFTQPFIFSNRVNAHPLEIFIVISIAGSTAGPAGMVLAIPAYTLFRIVAAETLSGFKVVDQLTASLRTSKEEKL
ncbi:MAG: AI-2E family transporter [Flavobacteriales bacterium]